MSQAMAVTRAGIEQLLYLMDQSFDGNDDHSLLSNLRSICDEDWQWLPQGGSRTIFEHVRHIGECKYVYENHAFGDGSMHWAQPETVPTVSQDTSRDDVLAWLRGGQQALRGSVSALEDDEELTRPRRANWGQEYETRWLIAVMIQHDLYHGGEINHIRALSQDNDRWPSYGS